MVKYWIKAPKTLTMKHIRGFLSETEVVFSSEGKYIENCILDLTKTRKINVLGMLIIYKIIEYSVEKGCFDKPQITEGEFIKQKWDEYEFGPLIKSYIRQKDTSSKFKHLRVQLTDKFIIAPQPLLRESNFTENFLRNKFLPKIREYYENEEKVIQMIFTCFSEILLNFWEHAVNDTKSIMIADGNRSHIEIACADTGNGIISTLKKNPKYASLSNVECIKRCVQKDVTSKEMTNHMGFGLWIIDSIVTEVGGRLALFSEGVNYINEQGSVSYGRTGHWQGTIVYISLPISKPKSLQDISSYNKEEFDTIKVDFI